MYNDMMSQHFDSFDDCDYNFVAYWRSKVPFLGAQFKGQKIVNSYNLGVSLELLCTVEIGSWTSTIVKPAQWRFSMFPGCIYMMLANIDYWPRSATNRDKGDSSVRHFITSMLVFVLCLNPSNYNDVKSQTNIILTNFEL